MEKLGEIIALGGLLHDIGKVAQRISGGKHSSIGAEFLRDLANKTKIKEYEILALFSEFHHKGDMVNEKGEIKEELKEKIKKVAEEFKISERELINALWLVYESDNISSSEREEASKLNIRNPLKSIFTSIDIGKGSVESKYYPLMPLEFKREFPSPQKNIEEKKIKEDYIDLKNNIYDDLKKLKKISIDRILVILEHYLTFVPAMTSKENDISLYDHLRMTSAIALALYHYHKNDFNMDPKDFINKLNNDEMKFLLIEADFSGIQDFIYTINIRGALKYLRARSTYLDLLSWDIVMEIIERLNLTRANVIYNGGGNFIILAQNTEEAKSKLKEIRKEVCKWLYDKFEGSLYLAMEWIEITPKELKDFKNGELWKELKAKVDERKNKRFVDIINEISLIDRDGFEKKKECDVCKKQVKEGELEYIEDKDIHVCKMCKYLWNLGDRLPKVQGFLRMKGKIDDTDIKYPSIKCPFSTFYAIESLESITNKFINKFRGIVFLKNSFDIFAVPENFEILPYIVADYAKIADETKHIISFDKLAEYSIGAKKIGVLRADVDNLGLIFAKGLKNTSPSRLATLSRFLDYFFKGYLNQIIQGKFQNAIEDVPMLRVEEELKPNNEKANIVVVYAGGDDLFIVGSWNEVFTLTFKIRELFKKYVGENPNITLSAGIGFFDEKYPLARMAEVTKERLEKAKDEGKNRVMLLERFEIDFPEFAETHKVSYGWDHYKDLWKKYAESIYKINKEKKEIELIELKETNGKGKKLSKSLIWKIIQAQELYARNPKSIRWAYILAYYLGRHGAEKIFKDLLTIDISKARNKPQEIYFVDGVLKVLLFAIRR
ncbi:type III-A CRISPR-associated protein Cas10/Csm1 [Methanotorris igneus]|uniref:CRISPR system single-strand-specific deoxyribonuclease Cas10/Csm1 (subtype III-A) n=1 Tax=Methanotorris igneus (strain DSM 5666 / JCM 11834 / Kol 5) TaxID=880724 RepID=F6BES8_METIK|nr:type III-A CRISPR-associated protein Cas10/Csm1 [Methanotorris igneus]AEF96875.1 CRISPR-associated protein, Csm1 family [Methanotorris igneus Kol 5]